MFHVKSGQTSTSYAKCTGRRAYYSTLFMNTIWIAFYFGNLMLDCSEC